MTSTAENPSGVRETTLTDFLLARIEEDEAVARTPDEDIPSKMLVGGRIIDRDARALAECKAKRRVVSEHHNPLGRGRCVTCTRYDLPCPTLRFLALPYADHPEYREEWRL